MSQFEARKQKQQTVPVGSGLIQAHAKPRPAASRETTTPARAQADFSGVPATSPKSDAALAKFSASKTHLRIAGPMAEKLRSALEKISGTTVQMQPVKTADGSSVFEVTGFTSTSETFTQEQAYLRELISNGRFTITITTDADASWLGGGAYDPRSKTVSLAPKLLEGRTILHIGFESTRTVKKVEWVARHWDWLGDVLAPDKVDLKAIYAEDWDTLAHELFGHAIDDIRKQDRDEDTAIDRANEIREKLGKTRRTQR